MQAEQAFELERSGKITEAGPLVQQAIEGKGLNPDQLSEAYLLRARWHCATDKLSEAEADLELAERGSPNPSSWHFTRAILLAKQGKAAESKSEFNTAKKIDPTLKMP
jgi:Flp pilus assembly protein TadD